MRMLLVNRQQLLTKALDLENSARGSLKVFGLRIGTVTRRTFEARVLELVAEGRSLMANTKPMLRVRRALIEEFERLDRLCRQLARRDQSAEKGNELAIVGRGRGKTHLQRTAGGPPQSDCGRVCELI